MNPTCQNRRAHEGLDKLFLGELRDEEFAWLRSHVAGCSECRLRYERVTVADARLAGNGQGMSAERLALLQSQVLQRAAAASQAETKQARTGLRRWTWLVPLLGTAAVAGIVALLTPPQDSPDDGWQARSGGGETWGIRAFCVELGDTPKVIAEAAPGQTLVCPPSGAIQFTYTAPGAARLTISGVSSSGAPLQFFPDAEDGGGRVKQGNDVALGFSTPVGPWLKGPLEVKARFADPDSGALLGESGVVVSP